MKHICPECRGDAVVDFYPFCSLHCRSLDLSRWLSGEYMITGKTVDAPDEDLCEDS